MWCDNLPRNQGRLSQVTSPYELFINNHNVTFERNPVLFNCSQEFTRNFGISQPSWKSNAKNTKIFKRKVWQIAPVYPIYFANYWQALVPHPFRFGYHFVSVYYHLKEHYVNFFRFFNASLTTLYTHRIIEFSKTLISNHFLLGLWI